MTSADLHPELRKLIDTRLEAIDRVLTAALVSWSERRSILGEVETQIFELLSRRSPTPTHDDVLAVLESLDTPESYAAADLRERAPQMHAWNEAAKSYWRKLPGDTVSVVVNFVPKAAAVVVLLIANGVVIALIAATEGVIPWIVTLSGIVWLNYQAVRWLRTRPVSSVSSLLNDVRYKFGSWLMPKHASQPA